MKLSFQYGTNVLTLPAKALEQLNTASPTELRVLLRLAACVGVGEISTAALAASLGIDEASVKGAIDFWRGAGILSTDTSSTDASVCDASVSDEAVGGEPTAPSVQVNARTGIDGRRVTTVQTDEMPHYTGEEITRIFTENAQLSGMIDECQNILGKLFNPTEVNKLLALTEYYRLDFEYVVLLCYHCKKIGKASVPYVDKLAKSLWQEGIVTTEALEEKLALLSAAADLGSTFRQLSGAGKRSFTEREQKFFTQWTKWQVTPELLKLAYEVTVDNTGAPSMPYINKVLSNWQEAGYRTPVEVVAAMEAYKQKKEAKAKGDSFSSFDTDEFFEAALNRTLEIHKNLIDQKN